MNEFSKDCSIFKSRWGILLIASKLLLRPEGILMGIKISRVQFAANNHEWRSSYFTVLALPLIVVSTSYLV